MNRLLIAGLVLPALGLLSFNILHKESLPIGAPIPKADLRIKDVSGKELSLQEAKQANGLLVMFTCNTCPYVIRNQSRTNEVCKYAQSGKVGVVLLNANEGDRNGNNSFSEMQSYENRKVTNGPMPSTRTACWRMLSAPAVRRNAIFLTRAVSWCIMGPSMTVRATPAR